MHHIFTREFYLFLIIDSFHLSCTFDFDCFCVGPTFFHCSLDVYVSIALVCYDRCLPFFRPVRDELVCDERAVRRLVIGLGYNSEMGGVGKKD